MNKSGLTSEEARKFGTGRNVLTPPESETWLDILLDKFKDPIIIILCVADIFSLIVALATNEPPYESIAIFVAILITVGVGFYMDYSAKVQFESLNKISDTEMIKVIRDGRVTEVPKCDLCLGDLVLISTGDELPADIELIEAVDLHVNESSMTGESVAVTKLDHEEGNPTYPSNLVLRSTLVTEGSGKGLVVKIGDDTEIGKIYRSLK